MKTAFIFHGTEGYPEENWFPWLKKELESRNYEVCVPQFPTPDNQTPETWFAVFEKHKDMLGPDCKIFGHSLGGTFLLHVLQKYDITIDTACFVASPIGIPPIKNIKTDQPFLENPFDWGKICSSAKKYVVFHSDNDPYVGLENGKQLAENLNTQLMFIENARHFNKAAGYTKFEELLKYS